MTYVTTAYRKDGSVAEESEFTTHFVTAEFWFKYWSKRYPLVKLTDKFCRPLAEYGSV